ncbi:MAG TPA: GAF domain-containing protein, partial [Thermoanaerobaculia bacterium]
MPIVAHDHERPWRSWTLRLFLAYGVFGALILAGATLALWRETAATVAHVEDAGLVVTIFFALALATALLRFHLTERVFVSVILVVCAAMIPLLGGVVTAWLAVAASVTARLLAFHGIGPVKYDGADPELERARIFAQFTIYGVPTLSAAAVYALMGGAVPLTSATFRDALPIAASGLVLSLLNDAAASATLFTYGYSPRKTLVLCAIDTALIVVSLPYAIALTFAQVTAGWRLLLGLAFVGALMNGIGRRLASTIDVARRQLARATSLTTIGNAISLDQREDELLATIYAECANVVDVRNFAIAIHDLDAGELSFELEMRDGAPQPKRRAALAAPYREVISTQRPVRAPAASGDSWLGVPMITRRQAIGVLSVQSNVKHAFSDDDVVLLSAVASQAAAAIDHGTLVRNLDAKVRQRTAVIAATMRQLHERAEQLAAMNRVTQSITSMHDLDVMLQTISREILLMFGGRRSGITLLDETRNEFRVVADYTPIEGEPSSVGRTIPMGVQAAASILETKRPVVIPHAQVDPRTAGIHRALRERGTECLMSVPLLVRGEVIGTIVVETDVPERQFDDGDVIVAESLASQIAGAVEGARLYEEERRSRVLAEQLQAIAQIMNESLDLQVVLNAILDQLRRVLEYDSASVQLVEGEHMRVLAVR